MTIRARLTLTYAMLLIVAGGIMLTLVYVFMRFVPTYAIASTASVPVATSAMDEVLPTGAAPPAVRVTGVASATFELTSASDILNTLLLVSALVLVVLAVVGSIVGWIIAGRVLRPLKAINHAAHLASTGALDHRVGLDGPHDEVRDLSDTFDDMLDTLERSFQAQKRFTANASHELRTPIATIQTVLDVALADPDITPAQLRTTIERVRATNQRNARTVESLLDLAEIGYRVTRRERVDLAEIVAESLDDESVLIRRRGLEVTADLQPAEVVGEPVLIRQAVRNLLQNAVRHNVDGGAVHVATGLIDRGAAQVTVSNSGPVVSVELLPSLTEPFVRGLGRIDGAGAAEGSGLGLAIVQTVADTHHGSLTVTANEEGGLTVGFIVPSSALAPSAADPR
jgi:two-component system sensor histidine kinase VanS